MSIAQAFIACARLDREIQDKTRSCTVFDPQLRAARRALQEQCRSALLSDILACQERDVLGLLWRRAFYQPTNEFRAFFEQDHLRCREQVKAAFVLFLANGQAWYAALAQEFYSQTPTGSDELAGSLAEAHHAAELGCLIASADLQRYAVPLLPEMERKGAASSVRRQYLAAICRDARHGPLCNRLGVVEQERGDYVAAAWWFCRSLTCQHSFAGALKNWDVCSSAVLKAEADGGQHLPLDVAAASLCPRTELPPPRQLHEHLSQCLAWLEEHAGEWPGSDDAEAPARPLLRTALLCAVAESAGLPGNRSARGGWATGLLLGVAAWGMQALARRSRGMDGERKRCAPKEPRLANPQSTRLERKQHLLDLLRLLNGVLRALEAAREVRRDDASSELWGQELWTKARQSAEACASFLQRRGRNGERAGAEAGPVAARASCVQGLEKESALARLAWKAAVELRSSQPLSKHAVFLRRDVEGSISAAAASCLQALQNFCA